MNRWVTILALALLAGCGLSLGQGHVSQPILAALGTVAALQFVRRGPWWVGLVLFTVIYTLAVDLAYQGTVPLPLLARLGVFAAMGLCLGGLVLAQSRAQGRRPGVVTALLLPCGWVALEFLQGMFSPTGTWGSLAYGFTKPHLLPLAQLASFTGWVGLTFLVGWTASLVDLAILQKQRRPVFILLATLGLIWAGGGIRLATSPEPERDIQVALQHGPTLVEESDGELLQAHYLGWQLNDEQKAQVPLAAAAYQARMLDRLRNEALEQVDLVVWSEVLGWLDFAEEPAWTERVQELARTTETAFALGLGVYDPQRVRPYKNKLLVVDRQGSVIIEYLKAKATPGAWHVVGDGIIPVVDMPWGRLGGAICFDFDFPGLLQQVGQAGAQVVLAPSFDDDRVRHMHARMAAMRAIEQGFSLVRPTAFGISSVVDPFGRVTAYKDAYAGGGFVLRTEVPVHDTRTVFTRVGNAFGYLCGAGLFMALWWTWGARRPRQVPE